jgi:hypothetical protein
MGVPLFRRAVRPEPKASTAPYQNGALGIASLAAAVL